MKNIYFKDCFLNVNTRFVAKYGEIIRLTCNGNILYEGLYRDFTPYDISNIKSGNIVKLFVYIDNDFYYVDNNVIQKPLLNIKGETTFEAVYNFYQIVTEVIKNA